MAPPDGKTPDAPRPEGTRRRVRIRRAAVALIVLLVLGAAGGGLFWWKFLKDDPNDPYQAFGDGARARFAHGSLGSELVAGIPYPIFWVLPRVFPDLVEKYATAGYGPEKPGWGGYGAFGLAWEDGRALPTGLSVARRGFDRVTPNCALCHTAIYRLTPEEKPQFALGGPGHTVNVQGLIRFLFAAADDRRFVSTRLMPEMALHFRFDWLDWALYTFVLVPKTRLALRLAAAEMAWMDTKPAWGPGRDDAFNLPKYVLSRSPLDESVTNTDFPALWRLGNRDGHLLHVGGEATTLYSIVATSALGAGSLPGDTFEARNREIEAFIRTLEPPHYPLPIDTALAARGRPVFEAQCAACHAEGGPRTGKAIPIEEIGTDPEHVRGWTQADADRMNRVTSLLGAEGASLQGAQGYVAKPLVGTWLLAPYLHNGSVPTLAELLTPPERRSKVFYRGYDVIDLDGLGFIATGPEAEARGFRFDTGQRGNGNGGHAYGTDLPDADRRALIEFLKTL